VYRK
jgi:hypothetical protein